ncbi:MAG: alpha-N-acetylglucosaminidase [Bacteroidetes bacterium]|nr:alpha-N-acetylglucosaminidase [Bacteroidota bacterium]
MSRRMNFISYLFYFQWIKKYNKILLFIMMFFLKQPIQAEPSVDYKIVQSVGPQDQINAVKGLIERVVPQVASFFVPQMIEKENGADVFEVESRKGKIILSGSSGVAISVGLNWYLRHVCNRQMSWCGDNLDIKKSDIKAVPGGRFRNVLPHQHVVYMNYCTLSYSMAWWDWKRWQREIDFMALNGVNMPLGMVGLEGVWYNALLKVGLTDQEARQFLVGPAYFAWQWMQNIEDHCGPLPKSWIDSHIELGKKVLAAERAFGMTPIQQGFSGNVPLIFKEKFPSAKINQQPKWCNFPGVAQLDPMDPLFMKFGKIFLEEEGKLFGLGGYYAADPFHESAPPSDIPKEQLPEYLHNVGNNISKLLTETDPNAIWVMQSWSIRKEIAEAVPKHKLLVIDLAGKKWETTNGFWGHDFCVGQLHNFGGRINLHGDLSYIVSNPFARAKKDYPATALGTGLFPEGIGQNPVFYDCYFDMIWRNGSVNLDSWLDGYTKRRYGVSGGDVREAWVLLKDGPYRPGTNEVESSSMVAARPALDCKKSGPNAGFHVPYEKSSLVKAWELFLADKDRCGKMEGYRYDLVDIGRQVLSNLSQDLHQQVKDAFEKKNIQAFDSASSRFLDLLSDIDMLCGTRPEFSFNKWVTDARSWGTNEAEKSLYDKNASMLVTFWGPEKDPIIFDYSWREWSGLINGYYLPRWQKFHAFLRNKLVKGEPYSEKGLPLVHGRETWRANDFYSALADWEEHWVDTPKNLKDNQSKNKNEIMVADRLFKKWKPVLDKMYSMTVDNAKNKPV